jgi:hypothetical protein
MADLSVRVKNFLKVKNGGTLSVHDLNEELRESQRKIESVPQGTRRYAALTEHMEVVMASIGNKARQLVNSGKDPFMRTCESFVRK